MNVKISDFGLATRLNIPDEKHFTMCGTPNFISPEIASRNAHGLEADVWSLGCMMYTFLTGKPPFDTDGIRNTLNRVVHSDYEIPDYLSAEAKDLIACLLKKNPLERLPLRKVLEHPFMNNVTIKKQHQSRISQTPSPNSTAAVSLLSSSLKANANSGSGGGASFNESIDSGRGTLTTSTTSKRSPPNVKTNKISSNTLTDSINCGSTSSYSPISCPDPVKNIANLPHHHTPAITSASINPYNLNNSSSSASSSTSINKNSTKQSSLNHTSNKLTNNKDSTIDSQTEIIDKNHHQNKFFKTPLSFPTPPSPPVKLTSISPTKEKLSNSHVSSGFNNINSSLHRQYIQTTNNIFTPYQSSNMNEFNSSENITHSHIENTQYIENDLSKSIKTMSFNNNNKNGFMLASDNAAMTNLSNLVDLNHTKPSSLDNCSLNNRSHNNTSSNQSPTSPLSALNKKTRKNSKIEEQQQIKKNTSHDPISPLKTGSTLLRPTRQAAKNAVVINSLKINYFLIF
jgi:hypothetical protein